jgi:hypothetical protein
MRLTNSSQAIVATKSARFVASSFMESLRGKGRRVLLGLLLTGATPLALAGAGTWTTGTDSPVSINAISMDPYVPSQLVVSSGSGFGRTADSGSSWEFVLHGVNPTQGKTDTLPYFPSANLARLHNQTNVLFSGTPGRGLFRNFTNATQPNWPSTCGTDTLPDPLPRSWEQIAFTGIGAISDPKVVNISALATPQNQAWLAVGVTGVGVYVLSNAGQSPTSRIAQCVGGFYVTSTTYPAETWQSTAPAGLPTTPTATTLAFDPTQPASTAIGSAIIYTGMAGQGIYLSVNGGGNWGAPGSQTIPSGASFTPASFNVAALTATSQSGQTVLFVAVTGSNAGVYKGVVTAGASAAASTIAWTQLSGSLPGLSNVRTIATDPTTPTKIYAGTFGYGIYSIDTSASSPTWNDISNGLYAANASALYVTSLQVDPLNPARLYAGTYGGFFTYEQVSTPKASISPSSLPSFSTSSLQQTITLTNAGVVPLTVSSITASGKFTVSNSCPPSLAVGSSCSLTVQYQPATSTDNGSLTITTGDPSSPIIVALSGSSGSSSSTSAPALSLSPSTLSQFTTANPLQTIKLTNTGTAPLLISGTVATGSFTPTSSCPTSLNPNSSCSILLEYKPTTSASENSLLVITSNDPASPAQIALNGVPDSSASSGSNGAVSATPSSLGFAGVPVNMQSATRSITLKNTSSQAVSISNVIVDNPAFIVDNSQCPNQLAAASSCNLLLAYTPVDGQAVTAALKVTVGGNTLLTVTLTGSSADQTTMTGSAYGSTSSLTLTGNFFFSSREQANSGNLYVAAFYNNQWFFFDGFAWQPWLTGSPRAYGPTATYASKTLTVFNRVDISQLKGAQFFLAYGSKFSDVARNLTFSLIYTAP